MSQAEQIARFCSALVGGSDGSGDDRLEGQMIYVWTLPEKRTRWCRADSPSAIASAVLDAASRQPGGVRNVYIGFGGVPEGLAKEKGWRSRPKADEVTMLPAFWADLDIDGPGHKGKNYPPDEASVRKILDSVGLPPTVIVHSGNGYQAWWVFTEPWLASDYDDPDAAREELAALLRDWTSTLRWRANVIGGWKIDSVYDLSRVMRPPGSWNCKDLENLKTVRIVGGDERATYELDDFRDRLAEQKILDAYSLKADSTAGGEINVKALPGVNLGEVWARVNSDYYQRSNYTPEWISTLLEFDDGRLAKIWDGNRPDLYGDASGYDAALVRELWEQGMKDPEFVVEGIMCRRLRAGESLDKVDPHRRTSYLTVTVTNIQALARQSEENRKKFDGLIERSASASIELPPEPDPEPEITESDMDDFTAYLEEELDASQAEPPSIAEVARREIEQQQGVSRPQRQVPEPSPEAPEPVTQKPEPVAPKAEPEKEPEPPRPPTGDAPASEPVAAVSPPPPPPPPPPVTPIRPGADDNDPWGTRNAETEEMMDLLSTLLIPEVFRARGVKVWRLEHKDYGENQRNRIAFWLPENFAWPANNPPSLYRVGRPLFSEWYKRDTFETPAGFRKALQWDAMIPAEPVGNRKDDWQRLISALVSYWERDSSSSDLASSAGEWLLHWLIGHAPTTDEAVALDNSRALLISHANWGHSGTPVVYMPLPPFLAYVAIQPGGLTGREGKRVLQYVHLMPRRPRLVDGGGTPRRVSWYEIAADQFSGDEWREVMEVTRQAMESQEKRLRAVGGGAS